MGSLSFDFYSTLAHQSGSDLDSFDAVAGKVGKHQGHEIGFNTGKDIFVLDDQHAQCVCMCVCVCVCVCVYVCTCCLSTFLSPIHTHTHKQLWRMFAFVSYRSVHKTLNVHFKQGLHPIFVYLFINWLWTIVIWDYCKIVGLTRTYI